MLSAIIEAYAGYERRALLLYRRLAERFAADKDVSARWRAMSDAEARHFTTLQLATDRLTMAGGATIEVDVDLGAIDADLNALEQAAAAVALGAQEAVVLAVEWEEREVARITGLVAALPDPVKAGVRTGVLGDIDTHYADLRALLAAAGRHDLEARVQALRTAATL
jgi:hypothetical protein